MTIDLARARRDTPGAAEFLHFNNAGAALMPTPVLEAQLRHLQQEAAMPRLALASHWPRGVASTQPRQISARKAVE